MTDNYYQIAGHVFRLSFSDKYIRKDNLSNYLPFRMEEDAEQYLFHLSVVDDMSMDGIYEQVGQFDDDIASIGVYKSEDGDFRFRIAHPTSKDYCTMDTDASFSKAEVQLLDAEWLRSFCLNNCLMLLYAFATAQLDTLMMHASVIKNNNEGFVFLGKSGTGKSTHSRLWLEHIAGSELLNDDNPVVRIIDGMAWVFGTPWSGKTPCYRNEKATLKGVVKLRQAPENNIKKLSSIQAYAIILPACSSMRWENEIASGIHSTVEKLVTTIACYQLDCLPDNEAAALCHTTTMENK